jgi:thiol-disulfide isomerase/thioredoxin
MIFPNIWERFSIANTLSIKSNEVMTKGFKKNNIWGDVIIGASLGPIFSACSPTYFVILATVLPVSFFLGLAYLLTYVLGLSISLVIIALIGERIIARVGKVSDPRGWFKKTFGVIFIIVAIGIISGYDKKLQINLLDSGFVDVTKIEQKLLDENQKKPTEVITPEVVKENTTKKDTYLSIKQKEKMFTLAPDISTPDGFINTDGLPITIKEFQGKKVVLLDIWTYSCINCQRTLPYLNEWYKKYEDKGLVIIGLHTPEFSFEKIQKNVEKATKEFGVRYPVVLDNDFSTWQAYKNQYWPRKYLIDIDGYIVYDHAGEGQYKETEIAIQKALKERADRLNMDTKLNDEITTPKNASTVDSFGVKSPEIYFGAARNEYLENGTSYFAGEQNFSLPTEIAPNKLYLDGKWNITTEYAENTDLANIVFNYNAKNVYMAAGSDKGVEIEIYKDDVFIKKINIKDETLYPIIEGSDYGKHVLKIKILNAGLKAFTFTFG